MVETRFVQTAERFWALAGGRSAIPADIEAAISWALPLDIHAIDRLSVRGVEEWARRRGFPCAFAGRDRRLRGCLVACRGEGVIIVDGTDPPVERRFTLAHEAAHFLLEYQDVRERAIAALGREIVAVLDGDRPPTRDERVDAVLAGMTLGVHTHLMERGPGGDACVRVAEAECDADRLALEMLAPEAEAAVLVATCVGPRYTVRAAGAAVVLAARFGLPLPVARAYARRLLRQETGGPSAREWLGIG